MPVRQRQIWGQIKFGQGQPRGALLWLRQRKGAALSYGLNGWTKTVTVASRLIDSDTYNSIRA